MKDKTLILQNARIVILIQSRLIVLNFRGLTEVYTSGIAI